VWYTTIWIFNPHDATAHVELSFLRRDQSNDPPAAVQSVEVTPGQVMQIDDAIATLFSVQGFGAIHAVSDVPVLLFSRIYSKATGQEDRDSSGQAFAAIPAERAIGTDQETDLIGLTNLVGGDFRYNVALPATRSGSASNCDPAPDTAGFPAPSICSRTSRSSSRSTTCSTTTSARATTSGCARRAVPGTGG